MVQDRIGLDLKISEKKGGAGFIMVSAVLAAFIFSLAGTQ
jgi:hypothetical protein